MHNSECDLQDFVGLFLPDLPLLFQIIALNA